MILTYRCRRCDEQLDIELEYKQNIESEFEDTIEDFEKLYGNLDETFKSVLFRQRIENYVEYIIPVKKMKEVI